MVSIRAAASLGKIESISTSGCKKEVNSMRVLAFFCGFWITLATDDFHRYPSYVAISPAPLMITCVCCTPESLQSDLLPSPSPSGKILGAVKSLRIQDATVSGQP